MVKSVILSNLQQITDKIFLLWTLYRARNYHAFALTLSTTLIQYSGLIRKAIRRLRYPIKSVYFCLKNDQESINEIIGIKLDSKYIRTDDISNEEIRKFINNNFIGKGKNARPFILPDNSDFLGFRKTAKIFYKNAYVKIKDISEGDYYSTDVIMYCKSTDYFNKITLPVNIPANGKVTKISNDNRNTTEIFPIKFCPELYSCYDDINNLITNWKNNKEILKNLGGNKLALLFEGPPGCGKTVLAHHLAFIAGLSNITDGKYDPKNKSIVCTGYKNTVIIFDDLDILWAYDRSSDNDGDSNINREKAIMFDSLMKFLDNQNSGNIIVFTTNYPDRFDEALFRPGRINRRIRFDRLTFSNCRKATEDIYAETGITTDLSEMVEHDATSAELINLIKNNISDSAAFVKDWNSYWQ